MEAPINAKIPTMPIFLPIRLMDAMLHPSAEVKGYIQDYLVEVVECDVFNC